MNITYYIDYTHGSQALSLTLLLVSNAIETRLYFKHFIYANVTNIINIFF